MALSGKDVTPIKELIDRIDGKALQRVETAPAETTPLDLSKLTDEELEKLAGIVDKATPENAPNQTADQDEDYD